MGVAALHRIQYSKNHGEKTDRRSKQNSQTNIEIIAYFEPEYYIIENPQNFMLSLPYDDIDYCRYGLTYSKRTQLWNNILTWEPRQNVIKTATRCLKIKKTQGDGAKDA